MATNKKPAEKTGDTAKAAKTTSSSTPSKPTSSAGKASGEIKEVVFSVFSPDSKTVHLAGEFNGWSPTATSLKKNKGGTWSIAVKLPKGTHQYKFIFDGVSWETDPKAPSALAEFGYNSIVKVD